MFNSGLDVVYFGFVCAMSVFENEERIRAEIVKGKGEEGTFSGVLKLEKWEKVGRG